MDLNSWLNSEVPNISKVIEQTNKDYFFKDKTIGFAGKQSVTKVIYHLRCALFPGVYEKHPIDETRADIYIGNNIRTAAVELSGLIEKALMNNCNVKDSKEDNCSICRSQADEITVKLMSKLPEIRNILNTDIHAAYDGDPAAHSTEEILLSYPSIEAISIYRIAHVLYDLSVPLVPRIMSEYAHQLTGIDIHPGARIGEYFFIDHGTGVVVGETCTIGNYVKIYQGVTLGAKSFPLDEDGNPIKGIKRHPDIEDNVVIYAGATILGGDTVIGHDSTIGGNVWLTHSVPPYSTVYNNQPSLLIKQEQNNI
ncbi:serine acetyltransferase [Oxobacter pfennigii]|uniref:Serine acetyltransferase n=1 Tax=Oxobacter pfennigii TaxID=36849 RepID=A0A0P9AJ26_9CLOT|nr:serine O-acetyltransferase EpsC [Oxobacter pfennigii]KPU45445.1 serine acetyltransferase [Oxobacter pfennigii]